ncbi:putative pterin-4-alpha-carbinolamine dehydratase family protein [Botrytis fragariae]|uniref:4a-hydroxytetrahydrobiopterin dehydratase n=1 Tax=Botrytis fragariae TaxID=1964551 RepID=A0A8H6B3X3_9HELO|nr:putative pterin-4-alpha-carbinolamine dehydratase family protein [Botrytis fragariae]KAF5878919.1 putative pterin-4-alpha-carbinolamine dehydratase family protein [Botrytis fragariae]
MKLPLSSIFRSPLIRFQAISRASRPTTFGQSNSPHQIRAFLVSTPRALQTKNLTSRQKATEEDKSQSDAAPQSTVSEEIGDFAKKHIEDVPQQSTSSVTAVQKSLEPLLRENGGKWVLANDRMSMERAITFKGFKDAWNFMNAIAAKCKQERHHPEWVNIYNKVFIRWTTHDLPGLTATDILMATFCDEQAIIHKEVYNVSKKEHLSENTQHEKFLSQAHQIANKLSSK